MNTRAHTTTILLVAIALIAFAANSLLCRMALGSNAIDPASFTTLRLASGAFILWLIVSWRHGLSGMSHSDRISSAMLFVYAIAFSFAYISLNAGIGALVLFGTVQVTMIVAGLRAGEIFPALSWSGLMLAIAGLAYLASPGLTAPAPLGIVMMMLAGFAWGVYSWRGHHGAGDPLTTTANNFIYAMPMTLVASLVFIGDLQLSTHGIVLALTSGGIASAGAYVIWYAALKRISATRAATVQLLVPMIAAFGGVVLLAEPVTWRLVIASAAIFGGVGLVLVTRVRDVITETRYVADVMTDTGPAGSAQGRTR